MMMKLLDMTRKYGSSTYNYPFEPYEVFDGFRGKPSYEYDKCVGCTACAIACPSNAINVKLDRDKNKLVWEFDCGRCIFCGRCDEVCPTNAINLSKDYELAVKFKKEDLIEQGELELQTCEVCKTPFTTKRLIANNLERLEKGGWKKNSLLEKIKYMKTCPECKKRIAIEKTTKYLHAGGNK